MTTTYAVREVFPTLQGEGFHAGRFAVFVRFAACNLWTGREQDRERDATRHDVACPRWCDTDFAGGARMDLGDLMRAIDTAADHYGAVTTRSRGEVQVDRGTPGLLVFTGGEPLLHLDRPLLDAVRDDYPDFTVAIETNGTVAPADGVHPDWVCVSPKVPVERLVVTSGSELKVVYPAYDPLAYESIEENFGHLYVSPEAQVEVGSVGVSEVSRSATRAAADFVLRHPHWRLSIQQHKLLGLP